MKICAAFFTIFCFLGPAVQKTQATFFGEDTRRSVTKNDVLPYKAVVRIHVALRNGKVRRCNGVIFESVYVATNAHCVQGVVAAIRVVTTDGVEHAAASYSVNPEYEHGDDSNHVIKMVPEDVAFIKMKKRLGIYRSLKISDFLRGDRRERLWLIAYHRDQWDQLKEERCQARINWWLFRDRAEYECDTGPSVSGAPLLARHPDTGEWYVVGLHSASGESFNAGFMVGGHKKASEFIRSHVSIQ